MAARKGGRTTRSAENDKRHEAKRRRDELKAAEAEAGKLAGRQEEAEREVEAAHRTAKQTQQTLDSAIERLDKATADAAAARERVDDLRGRSA